MHCLPVFASMGKGSVIGTIAWCFVHLKSDSVVSSLISAVMRHIWHGYWFSWPAIRSCWRSFGPSRNVVRAGRRSGLPERRIVLCRRRTIHLAEVSRWFLKMDSMRSMQALGWALKKVGFVKRSSEKRFLKHFPHSGLAFYASANRSRLFEIQGMKFIYVFLFGSKALWGNWKGHRGRTSEQQALTGW